MMVLFKISEIDLSNYRKELHNLFSTNCKTVHVLSKRKLNDTLELCLTLSPGFLKIFDAIFKIAVRLS